MSGPTHSESDKLMDVNTSVSASCSYSERTFKKY